MTVISHLSKQTMDTRLSGLPLPVSNVLGDMQVPGETNYQGESTHEISHPTFTDI